MGDIFKTIEEVENYVADLKNNNNPIRKYQTWPVDKHNQTLKNPEFHIPVTAKYYKITYTCKHFGTHKSRGKNIRKNKRVLASGCTYHITFKFDRAHQGFIVTSKDDKHNHEVGSEIYAYYAENRKICDKNKLQALKMLKAGAKPKLVRNIMQEKTSKIILTKDLHNLKQSSKGKPELEELASIGQEFFENEPGNGSSLSASNVLPSAETQNPQAVSPASSSAAGYNGQDSEIFEGTPASPIQYSALDVPLEVPLDVPAEKQPEGARVWGSLKGKNILNKVAEKAKNSVDSVITTLDPGMKEIINSVTPKGLKRKRKEEEQENDVVKTQKFIAASLDKLVNIVGNMNDNVVNIVSNLNENVIIMNNNISTLISILASKEGYITTDVVLK